VARLLNKRTVPIIISSSESRILSLKTMLSIYLRDIHNQLSVTIQSKANLNNKQLIPVHGEKSLDSSLENAHGHHHHHDCEYGQTSFSEHHSCHRHNSNIKLRLFLLSAIFVFVALGGLLAWSCVNAMPAWGFDLMRRALDDNLNSTSNQTRDTPPAGTDYQKQGQLAPLA
jgi:ABC-type Zn2+ transport system substrate-binding protein/surface adhesin